MPSPFPGLDPYLESHWGDVSCSVLVYASDQLNKCLPAGLVARIEETFLVSSENSSPPHRRIRVIDCNGGNAVVTVIELLSPANKASNSAIRAYRSKRDEFVAAGHNTVEIDLVREGGFVLAVPESRLPVGLNRSPLICIRRAYGRNLAEVYPAPLRERLPNVRIPLRQQDQDVILQLQPLFDECYRRGRYSSINYSVSPVPPLSDEDEQWADGLLRECGLR